MSTLAGKHILITGGSGSIGSTLVNQLLDHNPEVIRILDNSESRLYEIQSQLTDKNVNIQTNFTNIRDFDGVQEAMRGIDIVFHIAALKHVGLIEQNPVEGVKTNVLGTNHILKSANMEGVESVVVVSTDKASNPISSMGATKLLSERLVTAKSRISTDTTLSCVRFGNVLGTRGSVVPVFLNKLKKGKPLTVTDGSMTRFLMLPDEAAKFVIDAHERAKGGEIFVKKMPAFSLNTLVEAVTKGFGDTFATNSNSIEVNYIGARPGERFHEKLISEDEVRFAIEEEDLFILLPNYESNDYYKELDNSLDGEYTSENASHLPVENLVQMIEEVGIQNMVNY